MSLTIEGVTVPVAEGGHSVRHEPLAPSGRIYDGSFLSGVTSNRGHRRVWTFQTPEILIADIEAIEAVLDGYGSVTCNGTEVGTNVECHPANMQRTMDDGLLTASLSFELRESDPT